MTGDLPPPGVTVRRAHGGDWTLWRDIRLVALRESPAAFGSTYERERDFPEPLWRERLDDPDAISVLVLRGEAPVAMGAGFSDLPEWLHVVAMWVAPADRGQGLARLVLEALQEWADERGWRLHLDVANGNPRARRCYERYGFVATGETAPVREGSAEVTERMVLMAADG